MSCVKEFRPLMQAIDLPSNTVYLYMPRCKMWDCPVCGQLNKLLWIAKISEGIDHYKRDGIDDWMFCTITSSPKNKNRDQCLWVEPKAWKKLWSRIHYHYGGVRYAYIPELHKNGRVHWHFLMSGGITSDWWKEHSIKSGFGWKADSRPVKDGYHSALYVTKELGKQLKLKQWPKNLRRIRTNQKWPLIPSGDDFEDLELDWYYIGQSTHEMLMARQEILIKTTTMSIIILGKSAKDHRT